MRDPERALAASLMVLEVAAELPPGGVAPHEFVGDPSRWCEVCGKPDRNRIHDVREGGVDGR